MEHNNHDLMKRLLSQIKQLDDTIKQGSFKHPANKNCFNPNLFKSPNDDESYQHYLNEIYDNYYHLNTLLSSQSPQLEQISYLTEKIAHQIAALMREVATHYVQQKSHVQPSKTLQNIYEKHAQHLDYFRQLETKKFQLENLYQAQPSPKTKNDIELVIQRIDRCKAAIELIEEELDSVE